MKKIINLLILLIFVSVFPNISNAMYNREYTPDGALQLKLKQEYPSDNATVVIKELIRPSGVVYGTVWLSSSYPAIFTGPASVAMRLIIDGITIQPVLTAEGSAPSDYILGEDCKYLILLEANTYSLTDKIRNANTVEIEVLSTDLKTLQPKKHFFIKLDDTVLQDWKDMINTKYNKEQ